MTFQLQKEELSFTVLRCIIIADEVFEATKNSIGKCLAAETQLKNSAELKSYPVLGDHSNLQASASCFS
ncbi:hypothetical protein EJ110_NYTH28012 [Nymphaea thermarum]|nr:hypothetical protein EJ110_NYTH28012 [Nymphaea thermarum]